MNDWFMLSNGMTQGVLQGFYYLCKRVDDFVLRAEACLHFRAEASKIFLEFVEGFIMELFIELSLGG